MSNAFSTKETQGNEFRTIKSPLRFWLMGIFLFLGLFFFGVARATIIFEDDFNSYTEGNLNGQGGWACSPSPSTQVVIDSGEDKSALFYNGTNFSLNCYKSGSSATQGTLQFVFLAHSVIPAIGQGSRFSITNSPSSGSGIAIDLTEVAGSQIRISTFDNDFVDRILGYSPFDIEVLIQVEFDEDLYRVKINSGEFSEWWVSFGTLPYFDAIRILTSDCYYPGVRDLRFYYDDISGPPSVCSEENCYLCETEGTCEAANCFWYYSFYRQEYFCIDWEVCGDYGGCPFCSTQETCETYPTCWWLEDHCYFYGTCGDYHACPLCATQETCEAFETCEWVNNQCYFEEEMPPIIEWEGCEYEDCDPLGLPEKWVCLLKNMIMGQFCPSQDKITDLYNTFDTMKARFPFNYANAMSVFFTDIKNSLSEEKAIPFSILGKEGEVDFSFWENTTTIGGEVETFANLIKDFTSIIILLGFFLWLISFIKRFMA